MFSSIITKVWSLGSKNKTYTFMSMSENKDLQFMLLQESHFLTGGRTQCRIYIFCLNNVQLTNKYHLCVYVSSYIS